MTANEHLDPVTYPFEVVGLFEELIEPGGKCIGTRRLDCEQCPRPLGAAGRIEVSFTESFLVQRGHKLHLIKASPAKPVKVWSMLQVLCGRERHV